MDSFRLAFLRMSHLLANGWSSMVFEHFQDSFNLEDLANGFIQLHKLNSYVVIGYIAQSMAHIICVVKFLTLAKPSSDIQPITMGDAIYQLVNMV